VLLFALLLSLATGAGFGLLPALRASRTGPNEALKARGGEAPRRRAIALRDALVVAQVAGSLVMLVGAGLFLRSLSRAQAIDPGFDPERPSSSRSTSRRRATTRRAAPRSTPRSSSGSP